MLTFTNPRLHAEFTDWPLGGSKRGACTFNIEHNPKRGYRLTRTTFGKPKVGTYSGPAAIVDGDDGRTYVLQVAAGYGFIKVTKSDFYDNETVFQEDSPARHAELLTLIETAQLTWPASSPA